MVYTGKRTPRAGGIIAAPKSLAGKRFKSPTPFSIAGSPFMVYIRGFQAAGTGFHRDKLSKNMMHTIHKSVKKIGIKIFNQSQQTCPVGESKKLKASGRFIDNSRIIGNKEEFIDMHITYGGAGTGVVYAVYVHEGHSAPDGSWVMGRPWLVRAARRYKKSLLRATKRTAIGVWKNFAKQVSATSKWVEVGGGRYGTGAGQGWMRKLTGIGPTVTGR